MAAAGACMPAGSKRDSAANTSGNIASLARVIVPGIQLYTVRDAAARDLEGTLGALAGMGYREVELAGFYGRTPRAFRDALDGAGLLAPSGHMGLALLRGDSLEGSLDAAQLLGHEYVVVPWVDRADLPTAEHWRRFADELATLGARVKQRGLLLAYHNHDLELRPLLDGTIPYDVLLGVDPALMRMQMDVFWFVHGGGDPFAYIAKYPGRFDMIHVKDRARDGSQTEVGKGTIDFAGIFARASGAGITHAFVEHDQPADAFAFARNSIAHLRTLRAR